jgi:hypothetical protein
MRTAVKVIVMGGCGHNLCKDTVLEAVPHKGDNVDVDIPGIWLEAQTVVIGEEDIRVYCGVLGCMDSVLTERGFKLYDKARKV